MHSDGSIELVAEAAIAGLFDDCDIERANEAAALLRPMNPAVNLHPVTAAPWRDVFTTYVRCAEEAGRPIDGTGRLAQPRDGRRYLTTRSVNVHRGQA